MTTHRVLIVISGHPDLTGVIGHNGVTEQIWSIGIDSRGSLYRLLAKDVVDSLVELGFSRDGWRVAVYQDDPFGLASANMRLPGEAATPIEEFVARHRRRF